MACDGISGTERLRPGGMRRRRIVRRIVRRSRACAHLRRGARVDRDVCFVYLQAACGASMIRSMTGYGEAELDTGLGRLRAEVRTVNHRHFSLNLRLARSLERYEPQVRDWLRAMLPRGHVNCSLRLEAGEAAVDEIGRASCRERG